MKSPSSDVLSEYSEAKKKIDYLWLYAIPTLAILFFVGFFYLVWSLSTINEEHTKEMAMGDAMRFHDVVRRVNDYYVGTGEMNSDHADMTAAQDYHAQVEAFSSPMMMSHDSHMNHMEHSMSTSSTTFYSEYPFDTHANHTNHAAHTTQADPFLQAALTFLKENPDEVYYEYENIDDNGPLILRYAAPSIMSESCIACHNNHPDSTKKDWKVGDVGGILAISIQLAPATAFNTIDNPRLILSSLLLLAGSIGLFFTAYNLRHFSQRTIREIEGRTHQLELEVQERKQAEEKLTFAIEETQNANQAKSRFLATMSHELRTPLNAIIGYSEMLEEGLHEADKELANDSNRITRSGRHLLNLINDTLDLSKIEAGKLDLELSYINIYELTQYIEDLAFLLFSQKETVFQLNLDPSLKLIYTDEIRLRQILFNLLSNAAKFTDQGIVRLDIQKTVIANDEFIEFKIADTGIGMSEKVLSLIFNPFEQGDSGTSRKHGGTGLGLSITHRLVHLLGGEIEVKSVEGKGSVFLVRLRHLPISEVTN